MSVDVINKYGVVLRRMTGQDLELIREWRNHPKVAQHMVYRDYITKDMQVAWFDKIDNEVDHYFVVEWATRKVGLINIRDVDFQKKCGEAGVFFWDDECLNSDVPPRASLAIYEYAYEDLGLAYLMARVLSTNIRAIRYNKSMGFKLVPHALYDVGEIRFYRQDRDDFLKWRNRFACLFN